MCAVINFYLNVFSGPKNSATLLQWSGSSKLLDQEVQMTSQKKMSREKNYKLQYCEESKFSFFTQHQRISNTAKINVSEIDIRMLFMKALEKNHGRFRANWRTFTKPTQESSETKFLPHRKFKHKMFSPVLTSHTLT